jgi:hypothetical protein
MWIVHKQEFGYQPSESKSLGYYGPFASKIEAEDAAAAMHNPKKWIRYDVIKLTDPINQ